MRWLSLHVCHSLCSSEAVIDAEPSMKRETSLPIFGSSEW